MKYILKRGISLLLAVMLLISCGMVPAAVMAAGSATLSVSNASGKVNDIIYVDICIQDNMGFNALQFFLQYDNDLLVPLSISKNPAFSAMYQANLLYSENQVRVAASSAAAFTSDAVLFTVGFRIKPDIATGTAEILTQLELTVDHLADVDAVQLPRTEVDGTVTIAKKALVSIDVTSYPDKLQYYVGQSFDETGMQVTAYYDNLSSELVSDYTCSGFSSAVPGTVNITVNYLFLGVTKTDSFSVQILADTPTYSLDGTPPLHVNLGEDIDLSGLKVKTDFISGKPAEYTPVTAAMLTGYDKNALGADALGVKTVTVWYMGQIAGTFSITVNDVVVDITVAPPEQTYYKDVDTALDLTLGTVTKVWQSCLPDSPVQLTEGMLTHSVDFSALGTYPVSVTYAGITRLNAFSVYVVNDTPAGYELTGTLPLQVRLGDDIDIPADLKIKITYASGSIDNIPVTAAMLSDYGKNETGSGAVGIKPVTVTYGGYSGVFNITVTDYVTDITLVPPSKSRYFIGVDNALELSGGSAVRIMKSLIPQTPVPLTDATVSITHGVDFNAEGLYTVTVEYSGFEKTFSVEVVADTETYTLTGTAPASVNLGSDIDTDGLQVRIAYQSGKEPAFLPVTYAMLSGYDKTATGSSALGAKTVNVRYNGEDVDSFIITVLDVVVDIIVTPPVKLDYYIGVDNSLDLTGGSVRRVMQSQIETSAEALTEGMITNLSSIDLNEAGAYPVNITHAAISKSAAFTLNVIVKRVECINSITAPAKLIYRQGEAIDLSGGSISVTYNNGDAEIIGLSSPLVTVSGYDKQQQGSQTVTVTIDGIAASFAVRVVIVGDVDGDGQIASNDAMLILMNVAGLGTPFESWQQMAADMDMQDGVGSNDAMLVLLYVAGL